MPTDHYSAAGGAGDSLAAHAITPPAGATNAFACRGLSRATKGRDEWVGASDAVGWHRRPALPTRWRYERRLDRDGQPERRPGPEGAFAGEALVAERCVQRLCSMRATYGLAAAPPKLIVPASNTSAPAAVL